MGTFRELTLYLLKFASLASVATISTDIVRSIMYRAVPVHDYLTVIGLVVSLFTVVGYFVISVLSGAAAMAFIAVGKRFVPRTPSVAATITASLAASLTFAFISSAPLIRSPIMPVPAWWVVGIIFAATWTRYNRHLGTDIEPLR